MNANNKTDYREATVAILTTVKLLDNRYGEAYLTRILKADQKFELKRPEHAFLQTFAALKKMPKETLRNLFRFLVDNSYLTVADVNFGVLAITIKGEEFLSEPQAILLASAKLKTSRYDRLLSIELREIRKSICEKSGDRPFDIFSNYTLQTIIDEKPLDVASLKAVIGLREVIVDKYGAQIIQAVKRAVDLKKADAADRAARLIYSPGHQEIQALFNAGMELEEIAEKRQVKADTVQRALIRLHRSGKIDLKPWIERKLTPQVLEKGRSYFQENQDKRLKPAYEKLGLDYDSLRLCRLYVADIRQTTTELAYQA